MVGREGNNRRRYVGGPRSAMSACNNVCPATSPGGARIPKMAPDSVSPRDARRQLGKTCRIAVRGGQWQLKQSALWANTHCRFRHRGIGSH